MNNKMVLILGLIVLLQTSVMVAGLGNWAGPVLAEEKKQLEFKMVAVHNMGGMGIMAFCDPLHGNLLYTYVAISTPASAGGLTGNMVVLKDGCPKEAVPK